MPERNGRQPSRRTGKWKPANLLTTFSNQNLYRGACSFLELACCSLDVHARVTPHEDFDIHGFHIAYDLPVSAIYVLK